MRWADGVGDEMTEAEMRKSFMMRFRLLVCESNQTQVEIAKGTGINNKLLNKYLRGDIIPLPYNIVRICEYFHVSADWLLGLTKYRMPCHEFDSE